MEARALRAGRDAGALHREAEGAQERRQGGLPRPVRREGRRHYRQLNLGGWGNTAHGFETIVAKKQSALGGRANGSIETGRWYDIEVRVDGPRVEAWLDGAKVLETGAPLQRFQAIAGLDRAANEIVVKIVNGEERPVAASIAIRGAAPKSAGRRIELAGRLEDENTLAEPSKIVPVESPLPGVAPSFTLDLKPASLTVLRIPLVRSATGRGDAGHPGRPAGRRPEPGERPPLFPGVSSGRAGEPARTGREGPFSSTSALRCSMVCLAASEHGAHRPDTEKNGHHVAE